MEQERARAEQLGYEDPINPDFEATSASYHRCLAECMRRMHELKTQDMPQKVGIMVASHNADTIRFALTRYAKTFFQRVVARDYDARIYELAIKLFCHISPFEVVKAFVVSIRSNVHEVFDSEVRSFGPKFT